MKTLEQERIARMSAITADDKTTWGDGPWLNEPDYELWVDGATGYTCEIRRGPVGSFCGYVRLPELHPWIGKQVHDMGADVHCGITYARREPLNAAYVIGFDCGHLCDYSPMTAAAIRVMEPDLPMLSLLLRRQVYRTFGYVRDEVISLARQAHGAAEGA